MKYYLVLALIAYVLPSFFAHGSNENNRPTRTGIEFFKGSWQEALDASKANGKYIFVDVYAKWCGPCKQLKRTSFSDKQAGDYFNKSFINFSMNGETDEGKVFMRTYGVSSYPTLLIINSNGKIMARSEGFMKPYILINFGRRVVPL